VLKARREIYEALPDMRAWMPVYQAYIYQTGGADPIPGAGAGGARALLCEALPPAQRRRWSCASPQSEVLAAQGRVERGRRGVPAVPGGESRRIRRPRTLPPGAVPAEPGLGGAAALGGRAPAAPRLEDDPRPGAAPRRSACSGGRARRAARTTRVLGARPTRLARARCSPGTIGRRGVSLGRGPFAAPGTEGPRGPAAAAPDLGAYKGPAGQGRAHAGDAGGVAGAARAHRPPPGLL